MTTPAVQHAFEVQAEERIDHLEAASAALPDRAGGPGADRRTELAKAHALIAIAEALRDRKPAHPFKPAHELLPEVILADGSVVLEVAESFEEPDVIWLTVARGSRPFRMVVLRSTPMTLRAVALA